MMFYAPARAMREVRDRGALAPAGLVALLAHALFFLVDFSIGFVSVPSITRKGVV